MFQRKWIGRYAVLFVAVTLLCTALLYVAGLTPQERVTKNLQASGEQFADEGQYPYVFDSWSDACRLDAFSESLILNHSYYMDTREDALNVFNNWCYRDRYHPVTSLIALAENPDIEPNTTRNHYWMGFRAVARPLLALIPYPNIRGVVSAAFFALLAAAMLMLQKKADTIAAVCLLLTVVALNPVVVSTSLQFSCCFVIAFAGVIAVCQWWNSPVKLWAAFLLLGQMTMYFDFYTSPLLTWGVPFGALMSIRRAKDKPALGESLKLLGVSLAMWTAGYGGMWVMKMLCSTLFVGENGFLAVVDRVLSYTGLQESATASVTYTRWGALYNCLKNVFTVPNLFALAGAVIALAVWLIRLHVKGGIKLANSGIWVYALAAILPALWLMCASQASGKHAYFQYRTLGVMVYAVFCFATQLFEPKKV